MSIGEGGLGIERRKRMGDRNPYRGEVHLSQGRGAGCLQCGEMWHIQKDCKQDREGKGKEKDFSYITESDGSDALILSLVESSES